MPGRRGCTDPEVGGADAKATLATLGERLPDEESRTLAELLPDRMGMALRVRKQPSSFDLAEFFDRVRQREGTSLGFAREHAQVVCRVVGEVLSEDALRAFDRVLPEPFAELFHPPASDEEPAEYGLAKVAQHHHSLATGRPGSQHPLSESRPERAHTHSVAREANPHVDTKLSSATGMTQERAEESLATAKPDMRRRIGESTD